MGITSNACPKYWRSSFPLEHNWRSEYCWSQITYDESYSGNDLSKTWPRKCNIRWEFQYSIILMTLFTWSRDGYMKFSMAQYWFLNIIHMSSSSSGTKEFPYNTVFTCMLASEHNFLKSTLTSKVHDSNSVCWDSYTHLSHVHPHSPTSGLHQSTVRIIWIKVIRNRIQPWEP